VFSGDRPKNLNFIIESADKDENIRVPAVANITDEMRTIMPLTPDWTYWPDYERVSRGGGTERDRRGDAFDTVLSLDAPPDGSCIDKVASMACPIMPLTPDWTYWHGCELVRTGAGVVV
jgi:hypothetical protein